MPFAATSFLGSSASVAPAVRLVRLGLRRTPAYGLSSSPTPVAGRRLT